MFVSEALGVNQDGHLVIGGCDTIQLAQEYGTPLYIIDEELVRKNCRRFRNSIEEYYNGNGMVLYASKALNTKAICKIAEQEGLGLDVVSGGELFTAVKAGFPTEKIYFHGNNKTREEIEMALEYSVGRYIVDSFEELNMLNEAAELSGKKAHILLRIKPGVEAHTHEFIKTGQIDSKFGFALETGEAFDAVRQAVKMKNINLVGIHCHIGSQIFELEPFEEAAKVMMGFIKQIKDELKLEIAELNLGGGFGIKYTQSQNPLEYEQYIKIAAHSIKTAAKENNISLPKILIEPGRAIVGPAGITIYKVGSIKDIPGIRRYVSIDGGMTDNPRYILYQAEYEALVANKANEPKTQKVTIAGKCCESGDLIAEGAQLQDVKAGDYLAVLCTGAYNYSMSSNYNRIPRPPIVLAKGGQAKLIVKRESYEDIVRNDILPDDL